MARVNQTAVTAAFLSGSLKLPGVDIFYDHGYRTIDTMDSKGTVVSWLANSYSRESKLAELDMAAVEAGSGQAVALIEIEETDSTPKVILADAFGALLGDHITFRGEREFIVGPHTIVIILVRGAEEENTERLRYLEARIESLKQHTESLNRSIGRVVVDSYLDEMKRVWQLADLVRDWYRYGIVLTSNKGYRPGTMQARLRDEFRRDMEILRNLMTERVDYTPSRMDQMISVDDPIESTKRLLSKKEIQQGFKKLAEDGALYLSSESLVVRSKYRNMFPDEQIEEARRRLNEYGYFDQ